MNNNRTDRRRLRLLLLIAVVWVVVAGFLLLALLPQLPHSRLQWFLFIAFGPPLYVLGEGFFGWLFSPKHGCSISQRRFSVARILILFPVALALLALCWFLASLLTKS
jgi:hypothetical protein